MKTNIHLGLEINDQLIGQFDFDGLLTPLRGEINCKTLVRPTVAYEALEWTIPSLIAAYLLKPYFETLLTEAAKEHYPVLKDVISKLLKLGKENDATLIAAKQSSNKVNSSNTQSGFISFHMELKDGKYLKLLYDKNIPHSTWVESTEKMIELVKNHHQYYPDDLLTRRLKKLAYSSNSEFYCIYNPAPEEWDLLDLQSLVEYSQKMVRE